jgi:transcriptional regulator with XRE-family HTH domain
MKGKKEKYASPDPRVLLVWRDRMGFSQRDACEALGCSRSAWSDWESGKHEAPLYIRLACAALLMSMKPIR